MDLGDLVALASHVIQTICCGSLHLCRKYCYHGNVIHLLYFILFISIEISANWHTIEKAA